MSTNVGLRRHLVALVSATFAVSAVGLWTFRVGARQSQLESKELEALKQQMRGLSRLVLHPARPPALALEPAGAAPVAHPEVPEVLSVAPATLPLEEILAPDERTYRLGVVRDAQEKLIQETLARDPIDPEWSKTATDQLRSTFVGEGFADLNFSTECRSIICKVTFHSNNLVQGHEILQHMIQKVPWQTNGMSLLSAETGEASLYLAREGAELPQIDPKSLIY